VGNETTNLIVAGTLLLLQHPEHMMALRADLSKIPTFVEEVLRYESPVQDLFRIATWDTVLGSVPMPRVPRMTTATSPRKLVVQPSPCGCTVSYR